MPTRYNSNSNLYNGGLMAQSGDWVYYSDDDRLMLYKIRTDGTGKNEVYDAAARSINVVGDWVYFIRNSGSLSDPDDGGLFRVRTDGTGAARIGDDLVLEATTDGTWIYYVSAPDYLDMMPDDPKTDWPMPDGPMSDWPIPDDRTTDDPWQDDPMDLMMQMSLIRIRPDGTGRTVLADDVPGFCLDGGSIYYLVAEPSSMGMVGKLHRMKTDGTGITKVSDERMMNFIVEDGWVYYAKMLPNLLGLFGPFGDIGDPVYFRMRTDGSASNEIGKLGYGVMSIADDWIYYSDTDMIYKIRADGTEKKILSTYPAFSIYTFPDWVYFMAFTNDDSFGMALCRIRTNGYGLDQFGDGPTEKMLPSPPSTKLNIDCKMGETARIGDMAVTVNHAFAPTALGFMVNGRPMDIDGIPGEQIVVELTIKNQGKQPVEISEDWFSLLKSNARTHFPASMEIHKFEDDDWTPTRLAAGSSLRYCLVFSYPELARHQDGQALALQITTGEAGATGSSGSPNTVNIGIAPVADTSPDEPSALKAITPAISTRFSDWQDRQFLTYWNAFTKNGVKYHLFETWRMGRTEREFYYIKEGTNELYEAVTDPKRTDYPYVPGARTGIMGTA